MSTTATATRIDDRIARGPQVAFRDQPVERAEIFVVVSDWERRAIFLRLGDAYEPLPAHVP